MINDPKPKNSIQGRNELICYLLLIQIGQLGIANHVTAGGILYIDLFRSVYP